LGNLATVVTDLSVKRGFKTVVSGLNFEINQGEIVALVGASGQGKTTLLHALAGLTSISSGSISHRAANSVHTALSFQESLLLPWLTVRENIKFGFRFSAIKKHRKFAKGELNAKVDSLLSRIGISDLADRKVDQLSGGQAQRVSIARTIIVEPEILLLDEPFSALDVTARSSLQDWLLDLQKQLGLTIVIVTHDIDEAVRLGNRVLVLSNNGTELIEHNVVEGRSLTDLKQEIVYQI
jgi:ABC-type nitrate/sulfonate/bicarbonate transport system ATPase subunit